MSAATAPLKGGLCVVDQHPAEHDCRRIQVDFAVQLQLRGQSYPLRAAEMCGAGVKLIGQVPAVVGERVDIKLVFPGRTEPLLGNGTVTRVAGGELNVEFWAANDYEQQFLDSFVQACSRRNELRKAAACQHT